MGWAEPPGGGSGGSGADLDTVAAAAETEKPETVDQLGAYGRVALQQPAGALRRSAAVSSGWAQDAPTRAVRVMRMRVNRRDMVWTVNRKAVAEGRGENLGKVDENRGRRYENF